MRRSFETISGMIFNRLHPKFAAESVENEMLCLKAMCTDRTSFDAWFEDFLSNLLLKVIIYCVTGQPSITRSRRSVLNFKFSDLTFLRSLSCLMSIEQKLWYVKIFQLKSMSNAITCINKFLTVEISCISCLASIFNDNPARKKSPSGQGCEILQIVHSFLRENDTNS